MIMEKLQTERNVPADRIVSCHYDSMEYDEMTAKQMYVQLKERLSPEGKTYLFLDEVQEIKGREKVYLADNALKKREYNRLLEIHDNYPKYVLRADEFAGGNYEGIKTMHIVDFLLSSEY